MRFAEEMLLNSTRYKFTAYLYRDPSDDSRCALGMVNGDGEEYSDMNWSLKYPWLMEKPSIFPLPCKCRVQAEDLPNIASVVAHIFNEHVAQGENRINRILHPLRATVESWSIERLADWINSVDPILPEPENEEEFPVIVTGTIEQSVSV